jgi:hypothetical protein
MVMIITENVKKFKEIEEIIYEQVCKVGLELMGLILEDLDWQVMESRDKKKYRHNGYGKSSIKTVMGTLEYSRRVYISKEAIEGKKNHYLLDEELGLVCGVGQLSENLINRIIELSCEQPYRKASKSLSELSNQSLSAMGVWNTVQAVGSRLKDQEEMATMRAKKHVGLGEVEKKVLFEENDGVYISLQGKSRKQGSHAELKVGIAYSGAKQTGKKRYNLVDKVGYATFGSKEEFHNGKEGVIADYFNVDEIEHRILNADGASWARYEMNAEDNIHFQLDPYHRNRAIPRYVSDEDKREELRDLLYQGEIDILLQTIQGYVNDTADKEELQKEHENYTKLLSYYTNNKDGMIPYSKRGLDLPPPQGDTVYRNLGAMESNIFSLIGFRMKHRRANWSINGASHMAKLLVLKGTNRLHLTLDNINNSYIADDFAQQISNGLSAGKVPQRIGKGWNGFIQASIAPSFMWLKDFCAIKGFN